MQRATPPHRSCIPMPICSPHSPSITLAGKSETMYSSTLPAARLPRGRSAGLARRRSRSAYPLGQRENWMVQSARSSLGRGGRRSRSTRVGRHLQYRQRQLEKTLVATSLMSREQPAESASQSPAPPPSATESEPVTPPAESKKRTEMGKQTEISKKAPAPVPPPAENSLAVSKPVDKQVQAPNAIFPRPEPMRRSTSAGAAHSATGGYGLYGLPPSWPQRFHRPARISSSKRR